MRVLVLGAAGMLGHKVLQRLEHGFEVAGTIRDDAESYADLPALADAQLLSGIAADRPATVAAALDAFRPEAAINCIGAVKQIEEAKDPITAITINALFPQQLARLCGERGIRLIHFSTDCVFSGRRGNYNEDDVTDPDDLYGRTKLLGEVSGSRCLTLRTSIVGRELRRGTSLLEWFLSQRGGKVKGFTRALYTGFTTNSMADLMADVLANHPRLNGLWHVSSDPISKYDLLRIINRVYGLDIVIERDEEFACDRRLDSTRWRERTGFQPKSWESMIAEMHADSTIYV